MKVASRLERRQGSGSQESLREEGRGGERGDAIAANANDKLRAGMAGMRLRLERAWTGWAGCWRLSLTGVRKK